MSDNANLNKIDVNALKGAMGEISQDERKGIVDYGVNLSWKGGTTAEVNTLPLNLGGQALVRDFRWKVDEPEQLLGSNSSPTPQEYLLSGVGACIMVGFVVAASVKGVRIDKLDVEVRGNLDLAGFLGLNEDVPVELKWIEYNISVSGDGSPETFKEIEKQAVEFSPNAMTVAKGVPLSGNMKIS